MKTLLLLALLSLPCFVTGQITFEPVTTPKDFNIGQVRKSPIGEYFVQAANDAFSIYASPDGQTWTNAALPDHLNIKEMIFFSDGTPILQSEINRSFIRRNGIWDNLTAFGSEFDPIASYIKDDTLFVFQDNKFGYSIDKGLNFITLFSPSENVINHTAHLWKTQDKFVLHHTGGATDYLSVFNINGDRIFFQEMNLYIEEMIYNECEEILFTGFDQYYLFDIQNLSAESGHVDDIRPEWVYGIQFFSHAGHYYIKTDLNIYKTTGCNFNWEIISGDSLLSLNSNMWIDKHGTIIIYNTRNNHFFELTSGSTEWLEKSPDIDYASIYGINESVQHNQVVVTSNFVANKRTSESEWNTLMETGGGYYDIQYAPNGALYVNRGTDIQYSEDNGDHFTTIPLPQGLPFNSYFMEVLDDNIIFIVDDGLWQTFYSINNGQDWIPVDIFFLYDFPLVKLVDDHLMIASLYYENLVIKININTNEVESEVIGDFYFLDFFGAAFLDDGALYFHAWDFAEDIQGLFRYRFGDEVEYLGPFDELQFIPDIYGSGNDLYAFDQQEYHVYDGEHFESLPYTGLPEAANKYFYIADNQHVYAIANNHTIYRSTQPLSFRQTISGSIYHHEVQDCIPDTTDSKLSHWQVKVENANYLRIKNTDASGQFSFSIPEGNYTISSQPINNHWELCDETFNVVIDENTLTAEQDFIAKPLSACSELQIDFSTPLLRRCFDNYYFVNVRNTGPEETDGTLLTIELDPFFIFQSASIPYTLVGDSILKFDLGILQLNDEISFHIVFKVSCEADLGMEHCLSGTLTDDNLCGTARSSYTECQENIGSYDPNDKRVFNEAGEEAERIDKGEYIYYHIRFQNTGTDTAFNIEIIDPLSPILDLSTLEMLSSSHPYEYVITDGPALKVNFYDVLLVDSTTNEPASHGYFKFRIKPFAAFDYGTSIPNQAGIYFDFNEAVLTNEAILRILPPVGTKGVEALFDFNIYPNPTNDFISLIIPENEWQRISHYSILDPLGRVVHHAKFANNTKIDVAHFQPGLYTILLKENETILGARKFSKL